jgi:hypothetical protein
MLIQGGADFIFRIAPSAIGHKVPLFAPGGKAQEHDTP